VEAGGCRRIDIRHGQKCQKHHAHFWHRSPKGPYRIAMAELVQGLDRREAEADQDEVVRCEKLIGYAPAQFRPMLCRQHGSRHHDEEPQQLPWRRTTIALPAASGTAVDLD
jgi:hypothetical protein